MKAIIVIIVLLGLQIPTAFAENRGDNNDLNDTNETICIECAYLTPRIPLQATYEDQTDLMELMNLQSLRLQVPMEASFSDNPLMPFTENNQLKPRVPELAPFEEAF